MQHLDTRSAATGRVCLFTGWLMARRSRVRRRALLTAIGIAAAARKPAAVGIAAPVRDVTAVRVTASAGNIAAVGIAAAAFDPAAVGITTAALGALVLHVHFERGVVHMVARRAQEELA